MFLYIVVKMDRDYTENLKAFMDHDLAVEYRNNLAHRYKDDNFVFYIESIEIEEE